MKAFGFGRKLTAVLAAAAVSVTTAAALPVSAATGDIGMDKAEATALSHIGVEAKDVTVYKTEYERDDGVSYYEIEFIHGSTRYDVDVRADDGSILGVTKKLRRPADSGRSTAAIGEVKAKEKALDCAGVAAKDATFTKVRLDRDDGLRSYEIEFTDSAKKYEVELLAADGTVLEYTWKKLAVKTAGTTVSGAITAERAKEIALKHAGVSASGASFTKTKLDRDDGYLEYDVEFVAGNMEYEFEIDAMTGNVLSYDVERIGH